MEDPILEQNRRLPPERRQEVLAFAEFLALETGSSSEASVRAWPQNFTTQVLGGWQGLPLERGWQGAYEIREEWGPG